MAGRRRERATTLVSRRRTPRATMPFPSGANASARVGVAFGGVRVGINGFGRIGRLFFRAAEALSSSIDVVAVNDPALESVEYAAYLLRRDSTYGRFPGTVEVETVEDGTKVLRVDGRRVRVTHESDPKDVPWHEQDVRLVVDASGKFLTAETAGAHLHKGDETDAEHPSRVVLTAPPKDDIVPTYVLGVNEHRYVADGYPRVVSNASCTTNCLAPLAKVVDDAFGVESGAMTTVHALTISQPSVDGHCSKDWSRGRSGVQNIVPTTSGAAKALAKVLPGLGGKVKGYALRVPIATVSAVDFTVNLRTDASFEHMKAAIEHAATGAMRGIVSVETEPSVSTDFVGNASSCVFDASASFAITPRCHKLVAWYDNEYGYACRTVELVEYIDRADRDKARLDALLAEKQKRESEAATSSAAAA